MRVKHHLNQAGLTIWLICFYVDDVHIVLAHLPLGWRWVSQDQLPAWPGGRVTVPEEEGSFQYKLESEFPNKRLPTLDFTLWVTKLDVEQYEQCPWRLHHAK